MRSLRQFYWYSSSIIRRHAKTITASFLVGIIATIMAPLILRALPKSRTKYIGRAGSYTLSQLPLDIQLMVSDGLTSIDDSLEPQPDLAQSWQTKEDGKVYQFTLNPNRYWQDGKQVTPEDINYSFPNIVTEKDPTSITFVLEEQFAPFPSIVSQPIFRRKTKTRFFFIKRTQIIGTNEYIIDHLQTKDNIITSLTLKSDDETKVYRFYPTEEDAIIAFKAGKIDSLENISGTRDLATWSNVTITPNQHLDQHLVILFNTADPDLSSKTFRQALAYALPTKNGENERAISPIHPQSWAYNPQVKPYVYNTDTARSLLEKEFADVDRPLPTLELTTTQTYADTAETIVAAWKDLGLNISLKVINFPDTNDFQMLLIGQKSTTDPDQYTLWHSTQPTNFTRYNSPRVDKLLEDGRKTINKDERTLIYQDFQRFLVEDTPAIFLHYLTTYTITRN